MAESSTARWEPTARWERRYREVLDVAATIFAEKGYAGASTRDIADRLGVRQASLYYYFPSKEAALAAICELGVKEFIANLQTIIGEPRNAADKLRAAIANHLSPLRSQPEADYIRVFLRHRHELPDGSRQSVAALARTYQSLIEQLFVGGIASGQLRSDLDPRLATLSLLGLCNSVIANRALPRSTTIDEIIEEYAKIMTDGVMSKKGKLRSRTPRQKPKPRAGSDKR
jgi:TetR/AcrR family transcriptional regulator, cholesterol catabolism regulator